MGVLALPCGEGTYHIYTRRMGSCIIPTRLRYCYLGLGVCEVVNDAKYSVNNDSDHEERNAELLGLTGLNNVIPD